MATVRVLRAIDSAGVRSNYPDSPGRESDVVSIFYTNIGRGYALIRFDLSQIPSNATITNAILEWCIYGTTPEITRTIRANRITGTWVGNIVTWNTQPTFTSVDAPSVTSTFPLLWSTSWDVTTHVSQMIAGSLQNYGWLLEQTNYDPYAITQFHQNNLDLDTKLTITYTAPAAVEVTSPNGTSGSPTVYTDMVSGFFLTGRIESETGEPVKEFDAQIYDPNNDLGWETALKLNILSNNQISVETNTTGFTSVGGAALSRDTNNAIHGAASLKVTVNNADAAGVSISAPAMPGEHYSARVRMRADSGTPTLQMQLRIKDAGGAVLVSKAIPGRVLHSSYALTTGVCLPPTNAVNKNMTYWQIWEIEGVEAPYNAATVEIWITTAGAQTATWYVDLLELQPNTSLLPFIMDGSVSVTVPANVIKYGQVYAWRCKAVNVAGDSGWTPLAYFKCVMSKEGTPTLVAVPEEGVIRLALVSHPAENLAGYRVYRRKAGETEWYKLIDLITGTTVNDEIAANGQSYEYGVAAVAVDGYESPASDVVQGSVSVTNTFIGDLALEPAPRLDQIVRPFVGRVSPVLGSGYPDVQGQAAARQYRLEGWTQGTDFMRQLETMLALPNKVRYLDPWGETFYFQMMGELQMEKWTAEDLYHWQVEITEVS